MSGYSCYFWPSFKFPFILRGCILPATTLDCEPYSFAQSG